MLKAPEGSQSPQNVGNMVHKALETYYGSAGVMTPLESIVPMYEKMLEDFPDYEAAINRDKELATIMVNAYMEYLEEELVDLDLEFLGSEDALEAPLEGTDHIITGRNDAIARRKSTGGRVTIDHKTVKSLNELQKTAQIDPQFLTYDLIDFLVHGDKGDAIMINMLRRVNSENELSKPPYFGRFEIQHNLQELRNHWKHVVSLCDEMEKTVMALDEGEDHHKVVPPSPSKQCAWDCSYRGICGMFDDGGAVEAYLAANYEIGKTYAHQKEVPSAG